jgi:hypothetical protein
VQLRKQNNFYTGHGIQQTPISIGATVCIICDRFITGIETIHKLTKEDIRAHSKRLGVKSYEEYYQTKLKAEVSKQ